MFAASAVPAFEESDPVSPLTAGPSVLLIPIVMPVSWPRVVIDGPGTEPQRKEIHETHHGDDRPAGRRHRRPRRLYVDERHLVEHVVGRRGHVVDGRGFRL